MEEYYWDSKIDYLAQTRDLYYNDDYLEFLVKTVWKLNQPVNIVDFGCGFGYLGLKLLPLLPAGSRYTGIDAGAELLNRAEALFKELPYSTTFIQADIQQVDLDQEYDIALCHAFLLHMPNPQDILRKMISSVKSPGKITCFEPHWISNMSSYYLQGLEQSEIIQLGLLQSLFEQNTQRDGKDGNIGLKLPVYMDECGVVNIACRVSDKVNVLRPSMRQDEREELFQCLKEEGLGQTPDPSVVKRLIDKGFSDIEANKQYQAEVLFAKAFNLQSALAYAPNMKITYGDII